MLEIMSCGETRPEVIDCVQQFGRSLGLVVAVVNGESKGFIINRVWRAVKREALRVVDEGHAEPADVDRLWMLFFGTPFGPFGIMDMVPNLWPIGLAFLVFLITSIKSYRKTLG